MPSHARKSAAKKMSGKYTKPGLRERIKNRIMAGSKGGRPGQWSARKAQMLAAATKKKRAATKAGKQFARHGLHKGAKRSRA